MGRSDNRKTMKMRRKNAQRKKKATLKKRIAEKISNKPMYQKGAKPAPAKSPASVTQAPATPSASVRRPESGSES